MVSSAITPTRTIAILIGVAVIAVAGFAVVRSGVFEPETVQGVIPGPASSSPSASISESASPSASPSPTPSPKPTTPEQIKAKNVADAKAELSGYYVLLAEVANNGYEGWARKLAKYWVDPEIAGALSSVYRASQESGQYTTGSATIGDFKVIEYVSDDERFERVVMDTCVDFSDVRTFEEGGAEVKRDSGVPSRYVVTYALIHQGPGGIWAIDEETRHSGRAC